MIIGWNDKSDDALLEAIQAGNHHAFAILVKRHSTRFYSIAYRYMAQREAAEDIVQGCLLKLWENPHIWQPDYSAKFTTWFYRIVVNACLDAKKKKSPMPLAEGYEVDDEQYVPADEMLVEHEEQRALEEAIQTLPERQLSALNLCFYEGFSNKEAADIMQLSVKAVESLLMRAKAQLKEKLSRKHSAVAQQKAG